MADVFSLVIYSTSQCVCMNNVSCPDSEKEWTTEPFQNPRKPRKQKSPGNHNFGGPGGSTTLASLARSTPKAIPTDCFLYGWRRWLTWPPPPPPPSATTVISLTADAVPVSPQSSSRWLLVLFQSLPILLFPGWWWWWWWSMEVAG